MTENPTDYYTTIKHDYPVKGSVFMDTKQRTERTRTAPNLDVLITDIRQDKEMNIARRGLTALGIAGTMSAAIAGAAFGTIDVLKERVATPTIILEVGLTLAGIIATKGLHMHLQQLRQRTELLDSQYDTALNERYPLRRHYAHRS
jgi:hypothetical protein